MCVTETTKTSAASLRVPAIAMALEVQAKFQHATNYAKVDWSAASHITRLLAERVLRTGLPNGSHLLNVAIPATATPTTALRTPRQSLQNYYEERKPPTRDFTSPYRFVSHSAYDLPSLEPDSDIYAFAVDHIVSVTPLTLDLTARTLSPSWFTTPE